MYSTSTPQRSKSNSSRAGPFAGPKPEPMTVRRGQAAPIEMHCSARPRATMLLDSRSQEFVNGLCEPVRLIAHDEGVAVGDEL
jgi:hypothetical protein